MSTDKCGLCRRTRWLIRPEDDAAQALAVCKQCDGGPDGSPVQVAEGNQRRVWQL